MIAGTKSAKQSIIVDSTGTNEEIKMKCKRIFAIYLVVVITLMGANALANIFASLVEVKFDGNFPVTISYILNEWATAVVITIKQNDVVVKTIRIGPDENGSFKGPNSVVWDGTLDTGGSASNGVFTIEILAKDEIGHQTWELISLDQAPHNWFWSCAGVAANRRQTSPCFGMIYVCERSGGTSSVLDAIYTERGLYLFNSFAFYLANNQSSSYATGNAVVSWIPFGGNSPVGVYVGPDDRVYLSVLGTTGSEGGVVSGDGLYGASSVTEILPVHNLSNHGAVSRTAVVGTGSSRILYACEQLGEMTDFDPQTLSQNTKSVLRRYRIADSNGPFLEQGEQLLGDILVRPFDIDFDSKGYMYVVQNETTERATVNNTWGLSKWDISVDPPQEIWHVPTASLPPSDFKPVGLLPRLIGFAEKISSPSAPATNFVGIDIDEAHHRLYVARRGANSRAAGGPIFQILQFSMETGDFTDGLDTSVNVYVANGDTIVEDLGTAKDRGYNQRDVAVDAAGNVISVNSNTEALRVYSPPDGPNSFLTFSPWAVKVGAGASVIPTPITLPTEVKDITGLSAVSHFELLQNYPNPFNPNTTIEFSLPKSGYVSVKVYSILGKEVAILVNENCSEGRHTVVWNAENQANGIYYYVLKAGDYREVRKAVLMK
jgi:hypothetical protein